MNFPMQYPFFQFFYWLINTPGLGGIVVSLVGGFCVLVYSLIFRWIYKGGHASEDETYSYPTPALHHSLDDDDR